MATIYRKTVTKALPDDAELFERKGERLARWKDAKGRMRTAPVTVPSKGTHAGKTRIVITSRTFTAKFRNGSGIVVEHPTGCRDESAARQVLADLVRRAELVKANVMTAAEDSAADHQTCPLDEHFTSYLDKLEAEGTTAGHRKNVRRCINRLAKDCGWRRLADITRDSLERWLARQRRADMGARTRNLHRSAIMAFCNWSVETSRMVVNPIARVPMADEKSDRRKQRRSLTEDELNRLLRVARWRPLAEYGRETVRKAKDETKGRRTWTKAPLTLDTLDGAVERARASLHENPAFIEQLDLIGRERTLIYKSLVLTGLRKGELSSITVAQADLDGSVAFLILDAADEKERRGADVPLRADLAADLRHWLADKLTTLQDECRRRGEPVPNKLPSETPLFRVPRDLTKILYRDLLAAGIPRKDERGRTIDVHAMRHSFGTLLNKSGTAPRTVQAAMRHSSIDLTMNTYTDPKLLDIHGALDGLPALSLDADPKRERIAAKLTGTDGGTPIPFAPAFAPTPDDSSKSGATADKSDCRAIDDEREARHVVSLESVKRKQPMTSSVIGCSKERVTRLERATGSLGSCYSTN